MSCVNSTTKGKDLIRSSAIKHARDHYLLVLVLWKDATSGPKSAEAVNLFLESRYNLHLFFV